MTRLTDEPVEWELWVDREVIAGRRRCGIADFTLRIRGTDCGCWVASCGSGNWYWSSLERLHPRDFEIWREEPVDQELAERLLRPFLSLPMDDLPDNLVAVIERLRQELPVPE